MHFTDLINGGWQDFDFAPFRPGVEICVLLDGEPMVALLRYQPGARVPRHSHGGMETIVVLEGSQNDKDGLYKRGDFIINKSDSEHEVWSTDGCVILIQWERPVSFLE